MDVVTLTVLPCVIVISVITDICQASDNYPEKRYPMPCSQVGYTVKHFGKLCVPTQGKREFTEESEDRCRKQFNELCLEFNEGECMWYTHKCKGSNVTYQFPSCRLKYYAANYAKSYTWMEAYYVNQYGTSDTNKTLSSVLELHRFIKNHFAFPYDQNDFPDNVADPNAPMGVNWIELKDMTLTIPGKTLCANGVDSGDLCRIKVKDKMLDLYKSSQLGPYNRTEGLNTTAECDKWLLKGTKVDSCSVKFKLEIESSVGVWTFSQVVVWARAMFDGQNVIYTYGEMGGNSITPGLRLRAKP